MTRSIPRIVIAGTSSGVGKTSVSLGITAALKQRGYRVQAFKVGPDFLDPLWLTAAAGRSCYNLDGWMTGRDYVRQLFTAKTVDADIAVIEGVMGMFDGCSPASRAGSTAEIAAWLRAPVVLVTDAWGMAGSIAPLVKGFSEFDRDCHLAGVIANRCASPGHAAMLAQALAAAELPPLIGGIAQGAFPEMAERHLGLIPGRDGGTKNGMLSQLASACEESLDLNAVEKLAAAAPKLTATPGQVAFSTPASRFAARSSNSHPARIGIARDNAFLFYYQDNLEILAAHGAELIEFSPLNDRELPPGLTAVYIGGGYPELHAEALADNQTMRQAIADFATAGGALYAECGGLMYLSQTMATGHGTAEYPMCGILPCSTRMMPQLQALGYRESELVGDSIIGSPGTRFRGHEFRYSCLTEQVQTTPPPPWQPAYKIAGTQGEPPATEGFLTRNILASYLHQHFASGLPAGTRQTAG